ncbi:MAG: META domain-containing protein [Planctomycetes bacterium]|nr:META domain-containing protein [Planctomycetota bacterium]
MRTVFAVFIGLFLTAVAAPAVSADPIEPGIRYILIIADGSPVDLPHPAEIEFDAEGRVAGSVCNRYSGHATFRNSRFFMENAITTRMACMNPDLDALEKKVLRMFAAGVDVAKAGDIVTFSNADGFLVYRRASPLTASGLSAADLQGKKFVLAKLNGAAFRAERLPRIEFGRDLQVSGRLCNNFRGTATLADDTLTMENAASTMMMCADQSLNQLEQDFHRHLRDGVKVVLRDRKLHLTSLNDAWNAEFVQE